MKTSKLCLLLATELKSTSGINTIKYSDDDKKRSKIIGGYVGFLIIYIMIVAYGFFSTYGYGKIGLEKAAAGMCAVSIGALAFIFSLLRSNSYLYGFKEYDMLMAMPFEIRDVVGSKFIYMYIKLMPWYLCISFSSLAGYAVTAHPKAYAYIWWILLTPFLSIIPSLAASALGALIVGMGVKFKHKKLVQTILSFAIILISFSLRFIIDAIFKADKADEVLTKLAEGTESVSGWYLPAKWFEDAVNKGSVLEALVLIVVSIALYYVLFTFVARSYRRVNSKLSAGVTKKVKGVISYKKHSVVVTVAIKELKRLFGSTAYVTNCGFGYVMAILLGLAGLFLKAESIISTITGGSPLTPDKLVTAIPLFSFFFVGMAPTTCCSLSLEGKNNWIVQSMPIKKLDLYKGKMLMNMIISVPSMFIAALGLSICFRLSIIDALLCLVLSFLLCTYSTCFGMVTGINHAKYDWENEMEVIKQGTALAIYLFPNMIITMGLCVGAVALSFVMNPTYVMLMLIGLYLIFTFIFYGIVVRLSKK